MDTSENEKLEFSFDYENYYNKLERLVAQIKIVKKELSYVFFFLKELSKNYNMQLHELRCGPIL